MNVFVVVLMFILAAGFYFLDAPSTRVMETELEYASMQADLSAIAECAAAAQTAAINGFEFDDICLEQYAITTEFICLSEKQTITKCEIVRGKKPAFSFVITATGLLPADNYNNMLEILEKNYPNAGAFGIFMDGQILAGGGTGRRTVPETIVSTMGLEYGQLVYMTQFDIPDLITEYSGAPVPTVVCDSGTVQTYRFGRWQCIPQNETITCTGDNIWDSEFGACIPDDARKPLCDARQTAVIVNDVWECVDPFLNRECDAGYIARLNYSNLEWECVPDPASIKPTLKCDAPRLHAVIGANGPVGRITNCTDCEKMITDPDTCETLCIPDPDKLHDKKCYPDVAANIAGCSGPSRAFYFGFPSINYAMRVASVSEYSVPMGAQYSRNRKFNCMDCGDRNIDTDQSLPPFIAICD